MPEPPTPAGSIDALTADLVEVVRAVAASTADVRSVPDEVLLASFRSVEAAQRALDASRLSLLAELDARDEPARRTGLRTAGWLAHEFGLPRAQAGRQVGTARKLRHGLSQVSEALRQGRITIDHAALLGRLAVGRVEDIVRALQPELIDLAEGVRFERWGIEVRGLIDLADADGGHDPHAGRDRLTLSDGLSGELRVQADLTGDAAALIRAALLDELERRHRHHRSQRSADPDHVIPGRSQLLAEAMTELVRRGLAAPPGVRAPVTDVTLVIQASEPTAAHTPDGVRLQDGTTRRLLCDAAIRALVVDSLGVPLDLGTTVRHFSRDQRRAARMRDGGCVHPGCDAPPSWTQLHHTTHAHLGGPTDLALGASGCPVHHSLWHSRGWDIQPDGEGWFVITTPNGGRLASQRHGRQKE